ncbi:MAG: IPTL-CTERM sorting domain-containing protein, partial [Wenzhouxiangella sp.]|nr:IPTL-CTERM sorting domain-containing protein [Wenzhouxiangella sp.]
GGNGDTCSIDIEFDAAANGPYSNQLEITSDANINDNPLVDITGAADSVANLSVNPAFGPVDLGDVLVGNSTTANGSVSNSGSADGTFSCDASGLPAEITVSPDLSGGVTVPAGGSVDFSITCAVPSSATAGTVYSGDLVCSGDLSGTHTISCEATQFVPPENIPSLSQWGLIIMSVLMLMIGLVSVRFFRA